MNETAFIRIQCGICIALCAAVISCSAPTPTEPVTGAGDKHPAIPGDYGPQAGDRVKLTGVFRTGKGYVGRMGEVLIPHFANREEEGLKHRGKWVRVKGTLFAPSYPEEEDAQGVTRVQGVNKVQGLRGLHLELESIEMLTDEDIKHEKVEKLEPVQ
jgi:hypothetical protein